MKIVLLESLAISDETLAKHAALLKSQGHEFAAYVRDTDEQVQIRRAKDADVIMLANMPLSANVINACEHLKFINVAFTGVDHIALDAAKAKGAAVSNASGYANVSVAELALGFALALLRNVPQVGERTRSGGTKDGLVGRELKGKTVGIVGTGAIGLETAALFKAFGCDVIGYDLFPKVPAPLKYVSLEELLNKSDIVSLHCPLDPTTRDLINAERIALMKPRAYLINAARGPVVDSKALAAALNEGRLAGAAIDVYETEPPLAADHPLLHSKNTIVTPHIGFASEESMVLRAQIVFDSLQSWMNGKQVNKII